MTGERQPLIFNTSQVVRDLHISSLIHTDQLSFITSSEHKLHIASLKTAKHKNGKQKKELAVQTVD